MTTPAIPAGYLARMKSRSQAVKWKAVLFEKRQFQAYCCDIDSDGIMGVAKQPVVVLELGPSPVCLGEDVDWDFAGSYAPGSTVVSYAIDMGDGTSYSTDTGSHTYVAVGNYTVYATITEGLGKYTTITREIQVIDCSIPMLIAFAYTSYDGGGVYFIDFKAAAPAWKARNYGLIGNALYVRDMALRPGHKALPDGVHEIWIATKGGIYRSLNGGRSWYEGHPPDPSNLEFGDTPPATVGELDWHSVRFDPAVPNTAYILASKALVSRLWVYKTTDLGITWISRGVVTI